MTAGRIFLAFLLIGAMSFGGGVVAHLRNTLVTRNKWMDDEGFLELLAISQTLPGLKATNIAILAGDRLCGTLGSIAAIVGVCLPGATVMYLVSIAYSVEADRPLVEAGLEGGPPQLWASSSRRPYNSVGSRSMTCTTLLSSCS